jgi:DNA-binding NarL/FixJ family response regulator
MAPRATRVVLADGHEMFGDPVAGALRARHDIEVLVTTATGAAALAALAEHEVDVLVVDYGLPDLNGIEVVRRARRRDATLGALLLTGAAPGVGLVRLAVQGGCCGVLDKTRAISDLASSIQLAARGGAVITTEALRALANTGSSADALTARQLEVLALVAEGYGTKEIAKQLDLSRDSIRNSLQRALVKLGAHSRLEAVIIARRLGIV